jgi:hypothetical protein
MSARQSWLHLPQQHPLHQNPLSLPLLPHHPTLRRRQSLLHPRQLLWLLPNLRRLLRLRLKRRRLPSSRPHQPSLLFPSAASLCRRLARGLSTQLQPAPPPHHSAAAQSLNAHVRKLPAVPDVRLHSHPALAVRCIPPAPSLAVQVAPAEHQAVPALLQAEHVPALAHAPASAHGQVLLALPAHFLYPAKPRPVSVQVSVPVNVVVASDTRRPKKAR